MRLYIPWLLAPASLRLRDPRSVALVKRSFRLTSQGSRSSKSHFWAPDVDEKLTAKQPDPRTMDCPSFRSKYQDMLAPHLDPSVLPHVEEGWIQCARAVGIRVDGLPCANRRKWQRRSEVATIKAVVISWRSPASPLHVFDQEGRHASPEAVAIGMIKADDPEKGHKLVT